MTKPSNKRKAATAVAGNHPYARLYQAVILRAVHDRSRHGARTFTVRKFLASITGVETPVKKKPSGLEGIPNFP